MATFPNPPGVPSVKEATLSPFTINSLVQTEDGQLFRVRGFAAFDHTVNRAQAYTIANAATNNPPDSQTFVRFFSEVKTVTSGTNPWKAPAPPGDPETLARQAAFDKNKALSAQAIKDANDHPVAVIVPPALVHTSDESNVIIWGS